MIGRIPHLTTLSSRIREASGNNPETQRVQDFYLEQLQYSIYAASSAVIDLANTLAHSTDHVPRPDGEGLGVGTILLPEPVRNQLSFSVDHYFDAARRALNATNVYVSKTLRISVPSSFSDLVKQIAKGKLRLPKRIEYLTTNYWDAYGKKIKDYRDLSQHFVVISSDARVRVLPDGKAFYYLVLPNNPGEKNPAKLSYVNPRIDAFPYILDSYTTLYRYVFEMTHLLTSYTYSEGSDTTTVLFKSPLIIGVRHTIEGHQKPDIDNLRTYLLAGQVEIQKTMDSELPRKEIQPTLIVNGIKI